MIESSQLQLQLCFVWKTQVDAAQTKRPNKKNKLNKEAK